ncbi:MULTISPECIES: ABC transporter permease [unclassified Paraburkholderia]|uniref:ABC transporter permease n=1 Tax=unclassified Paraburkholderia TaxID=2615204 RepID=UPI001981ADFE|nr:MULTISPECIES: ABC transporter permease [unclassified Paraburkholderia]MBN3853278.1 ABC transporter permease [Paraburkholderia sp. Ac-20340]
MNTVIVRLLARRVGAAVLSLLAISAIVFAITAVLPGDAAQSQLGQDATPEAVAALRAQMGLDVPAPVRYWHWLTGMLTGHAGESMLTHLSVSSLVGDRLSHSLLLAGITTLVSVPIALALGILCAVLRGRAFDRTVSVGVLAVVSVPEFLVASLAVLLFAVKLQWLPALAYLDDGAPFGRVLRALAMPVMCLCCVIVAQMVRMTRAALIDQLKAPYIEMVRLKGATSFRMVMFHALPNAIGPIANAVALSLSYLLGGVIIIETVFNYPGIAKLMVDSVSQRDMPVVQACAMIFCFAYLVLVTLADVCGILGNPRLRHR